MSYQLYSIEEMIEKAQNWYKSPVGRASTIKAWETAQAASKNLKEETAIKPEHLQIVIGV